MSSAIPVPSSIPHLAQDEIESPPLSLTKLTWLRFRRHKMAMFGAVVLILLVLYSFFGAFFISETYANHNDVALGPITPSLTHPFGTDLTGRDLLARTIYGGQISLVIGVTAVVIETLAGVLIGAAAGYYGGWVDAKLMRITEARLNI